LPIFSPLLGIVIVAVVVGLVIAFSRRDHR
jgi:hypothetical protein